MRIFKDVSTNKLRIYIAGTNGNCKRIIFGRTDATSSPAHLFAIKKRKIIYYGVYDLKIALGKRLVRMYNNIGTT